MKLNREHLLILIAFLAALTVYAILALKGDTTRTLEDILLALVGTLAGITVPRSPS